MQLLVITSRDLLNAKKADEFHIMSICLRAENPTLMLMSRTPKGKEVRTEALRTFVYQ
jgi:hypothetical protein